MRWLALCVAVGVLGCDRADSTVIAIPTYRPESFRTDVESLIAGKHYEAAVAYLASARPGRQAKHDSVGYLAVAEDLIVLPEVEPMTSYDKSRDWCFPGTQDAIEDAVWQRAATQFAQRYNRERRSD